MRHLGGRYAGTEAEYRAPNGKPSKLLEALGEEKGREAWYAVRTAEFKQWFGDWEGAEKIAKIEGIGVKEITIGKPKDQKTAEAIARSFSPVKNKLDGRIAVIPVNTIGKIFGHKGFNVTQIIESIPSLYETAVLGWSESEERRKGHKTHPNIKAYHHYINKFTDGTIGYFIRFTVNEEKARRGKTGRNLIHSAAISDIAIYKNGDDSQRIRVISPGEASTSPFYDSKLAEFLNSVKPNSVSQVIDGNGEPLAVYHGTNAEFDTFDKEKRGTGAGAMNPAEGFFFTASRERAAQYGDTRAFFLNARAGRRDAKRLGIPKDHLRQGDDYIVFFPEQIKSATGNAGTYGPANPSVLFQFDEDPRRLKELAVVPRDAGTLSEAEAIVKNSGTGFLNRPLTNRLFDITATVSGKSLDEMTNEKLAKRAVSPRLQAKAVANADILFERAVIHAAHPDTHKREGVVRVHRFGALLEDGGEYVPVKITVKEFRNPGEGNRLYAIEAVDIEKMKSAGLMPDALDNPESSGPIADFTTKLLRLTEIVNTPEEDYGLLYQMTREEIYAAALKYESAEMLPKAPFPRRGGRNP